MKAILPSLKEKKRYIVFETEKTMKAIDNIIKSACLKFLGTYGCSKAGIQVLKTSNKKTIIRVNNKYVDHIKTALALNTKGKCTAVSGVLKKIKGK